MKTFLSPLSSEAEKACVLKMEQGDENAREMFILHNMRLVAHVVKKYQNQDETTDDLISIGTIGLIKAVSSFQSSYGSRFATYAIRCIENELLMYFRNKKKTRGEVSLFEPIGTDKEGNQIELMDVLENEEENIAGIVEKNQQLETIIANMEHVLTKREYLVICHRYGLSGKEELPQREIANMLHISRSYVSRIEKYALLKLKKLFE